MKKSFHTNLFAVAFVAAGLIISSGILAYAQTAALQTTDDAREKAALQGITFPIPELGNCGSEEACRAYCNDTAHIDACVSFAEAHGLMDQHEATQAKKFKEALQSGGGPGGCTGPADCQAFCSNTANLEACVKFAKDHGVKDEHAAQGEKILAYIKSGGHMPGNCNSKESCQAYCGDFSHAEECFTFAKNAGILEASREKGMEKVTPEQFQALAQLAKNGQTPGGCASKDACEAYCQVQAHRDECVAFGVKVGFIKPEEADMIKKSGGSGPGGCNSLDSCRAYCNDPDHQEECFKFAQDHGFISRDQATHAKEGFVRLRAGLEQAPPEVAACLKSTLGPTIIDDIQSGKLVPGPDIGERVRDCFEKFGGRGDPGEVFKHAPPEVISCLKDKIGSQFDDISSGKIMPTPEIADTFRVCFQQMQLQNGFQGQSGGPHNFGMPERKENVHPSEEMLKNFIRTAPPEILPCIQQQLGDDFNKIQTGQDAEIDASKLRGCFENFRHQSREGRQFREERGENLEGGTQHGIAPEKMNNPRPQESGERENFRGFNLPPLFSPDFVACLKHIAGDAAVAQLQSGQKPEGLVNAIQQCSAASPGSGIQSIQPQPGQNPPAFPSQGIQVPQQVPTSSGQIPPGY